MTERIRSTHVSYRELQLGSEHELSLSVAFIFLG